MLPRYIREMRRCNINASHEIFVAVLPFISLALRTLYSGRGCGGGGGEGVGRGEERRGGFEAERVRLEGPKGSEESEQRPSRGASSSSTAAAAAAAAIAVVTDDADYISPATAPLPSSLPIPRPRLGTTGLTYILRWLATHRIGARVSNETVRHPSFVLEARMKGNGARWDAGSSTLAFETVRKSPADLLYVCAHAQSRSALKVSHVNQSKPRGASKRLSSLAPPSIVPMENFSRSRISGRAFCFQAFEKSPTPLPTLIWLPPPCCLLSSPLLCSRTNESIFENHPAARSRYKFFIPRVLSSSSSSFLVILVVVVVVVVPGDE